MSNILYRSVPRIVQSLYMYIFIRYMVLGVALTVVIAWGTAAFHAIARRAGHYDDRVRWAYLGSTHVLLYSELSTLGATCYHHYVYPVDGRTAGELEEQFGCGPATTLSDIMRDWSARYIVEDRVVTPESDAILMTCGWPFASFRCTYEYAHVLDQGMYVARTSVSNGGIPLGSLLRGAEGDIEYGLPIAPIRFGFVLNAGIYAAIAAGVSLGVRLFVRSQRIRRGHCTRCGYDLQRLRATTECPECGSR